jgi:hypothetical protein
VKWYWGLAWLAGGASVGALAGAAFTSDSDRRYAAAVGAASGLTLTGIAALGATISPDTRAAGLTAVLPVAGLVVLGAVTGQHKQLRS